MSTDPATGTDDARDFQLGDASQRQVVMLYGDYSSEACRRLRDILNRISRRYEDRLRYVYRQFPAPASAAAQQAARAAVAAGRQDRFWEMHNALYNRGTDHSEPGLRRLAVELGLDIARFDRDRASDATEAHLAGDMQRAREDKVVTAPALFINGKHYRGAWDELSIREAIERPLGERIESARQKFFGWAASGGLLLVLATLAALFVANIGYHDAYEHLRETPFALVLGELAFSLSLEAWVNDGLMAFFFLIVGIEIKREIVNGELSDLSSAMLPLVGAVGGMLVPAAIYLGFNWGGPAQHGWGVPMATDIAFTLGLMALLGRRVPNSLRIFVSALAIADDLGAILVIALFYAEGFALTPFLGALACLAVMALLGRWRVYALTPYLILGVVLWVFVHESGLHATLAGVLTAALIPSRRTANVSEVAAQAVAVADAADAEKGAKPDLGILENAVMRLREPGVHLQHALENWTNFLILPLFAFFNTGVLIFGSSFSPMAPESLGTILGLTLGKPLGIFMACFLAVRLGAAQLSSEISWQQMLGAACLAGVGFTMSIFIATAAFEGPQLEAVKLSVLIGSVASAVCGMILLARPRRPLRPDRLA